VEHLPRCTEHGARVVVEPHDEGFGPVATLLDPAGNLFELVELTHNFGA
jgi:predicted enzyme related to lactoylglutathione lyase